MKAWTTGGRVEVAAKHQLYNVVSLPFIYKWFAAMPDNLQTIRIAIEAAVPHGRTDNGGRTDRGAWGDIPPHQVEVWAEIKLG